VEPGCWESKKHMFRYALLIGLLCCNLPIGLRRVAAAGIAAASVAKQKVKVAETRDRGVSDDTGERQMRGQKELR
jgi:hypothetical protein